MMVKLQISVLTDLQGKKTQTKIGETGDSEMVQTKIEEQYQLYKHTYRNKGLLSSSMSVVYRDKTMRESSVRVRVRSCKDGMQRLRW
jgi:hypothetical protein